MSFYAETIFLFKYRCLSWWNALFSVSDSMQHDFPFNVSPCSIHVLLLHFNSGSHRPRDSIISALYRPHNILHQIVIQWDFFRKICISVQFSVSFDSVLFSISLRCVILPVCVSQSSSIVCFSTCHKQCVGMWPQYCTSILFFSY